MIDRVKGEYWYWKTEADRRRAPKSDVSAAGLCPWCMWKVDVDEPGLYVCSNCAKTFRCADTKGTKIDAEELWARWICFDPDSPFIPDMLMLEEQPDEFAYRAEALSPSAFADLRKYWKHGHIILWKRLRMHARRWGLLKD